MAVHGIDGLNAAKYTVLAPRSPDGCFQLDGVVHSPPDGPRSRIRVAALPAEVQDDPAATVRCNT